MKLLPLYKVEPGMVLAQDVYPENDAVNVFLAGGTVLTQKALDALRAKGIMRIYIETAEPDPPRPTRPAPSAPVTWQPRHQPQPPPPVLPDALRRDALQTLERTFNDITVTDTGITGSREEAQHLESVVERMVSSILHKPGLMLNIQDLKSYDDYTYHHSLSVAVLAIGIGQALGIATLNLRQLGLAAIMHDIGKTAMPIELIHKPSPLSDDEFRLIQGHSTAGTSYLIGTQVGNERLWRAVLHHHERWDGRGYPRGLRGAAIPLWSRIISVADVYDALTSMRPYRTALPPADALEYIMGGVGAAFDYDVVSALVKKIDLYPVGSCVELSNGRLGLVLDNQSQMRPTIELLGTSEVVDLEQDRSYLSVVITRLLSPNGAVKK